jgi:DNA-directed RNA polymerase specialized sigma24 family protein
MSMHAPVPSPIDHTLVDGDLVVIRGVVRAFVAQFPVYGRDADDLVQGCWIHWSTVEHRHQSARGASRLTFLRRVVENALRDQLRRDRAAKRRPTQRPLSLDAPLSREGLSLGELLPAAAGIGDPVLAAERTDLTRRLAALAAAASPRQRALIEGVADGCNVAQISRTTDIPRRTLADQLQHLRHLAIAHGLQDFR